MSEAELEIILKSLDILGYVLAAITGAVITWLVTKKDRALQESIAKKEREDKYKLFTLENRIEVYQEAYGLCRKLLSTLDKKDEISKVANDCSKWWYNNCLFLDEKVRSEFHQAFLRASELYVPNPEERPKVWRKIFDVSRMIEEEMNLPKTEEKFLRDTAT